MYIDARVRGWKWGDASKKSFAASSHRRRDRISLKYFFFPFSSNRSGVELKNNWFIARLFSRSVCQTVFYFPIGTTTKTTLRKNPSKERWEVDGKWFSPHDVDWGMDRRRQKKSHRCPPNINGVFLISLFVCVCVGNLRKSHNGADSGDCGKVGWTWSLDSIIIWSAGVAFIDIYSMRRSFQMHKR